MKLYARCQRNSNTWYSTHEGMDQSAISTLLQSLGCSNIEFIDKSTYDSENTDN